MYTPLNMDKETGMKKKMQFTQNVLDKDLFPHCKTMKQKIYYLGYMTNKLLRTSFGWRKQDDRDSYINKRIDLTGTLLNNLFRNYFNKLVKDMQKQIVREIYDLALEPDKVADLVFDAVDSKQFYIFTEDTFRDAIINRHRNIESRTNPVLAANLVEEHLNE